MRTSDGFDVDWKYSDAPSISIPKKHVEELLSPDVVISCVAHTKLTTVQIVRLYPGRHRSIARRKVFYGLRLVKFNLVKLCAGRISNKDLQVALRGRNPTREQLVKQITERW